MIQNLMNEEKLVPSDLIVRLILKAMQETDNDKFLIDGFPGSEEDLTAFQSLAKIEPDFVLFLDCPGEEMTKRILSRNQVSEAMATILNYQVDAARPVQEVFESDAQAAKPKVCYTPTDNGTKPEGEIKTTKP